MFDRHSKPGPVDGGYGTTPRWIGDLSGAFADLGTFLPLVIGLLVLGQFDPTGILIGFGLFALATGLIYRLPIPVQPMKLAAGLAIAGGLTAEELMASGLLIGLALLLLGGSGLIDRMHRLVPRTVLAGLQLALGLYLFGASVELAKGSPGLGLLALGLFLLLLLTPLRSLGCILLLVVGIAWSLVAGDTRTPSVDLILQLPALSLPSSNAFGTAAITVFWPQLALTVANAILLTSVLAAEYFPNAKPDASPKRLALTSGGLNLLLAPIGAMPMCHGAGGLAAQVHQGARSGLAPVTFGAVCLALGLLAGPLAIDLLMLVPLPVVAVLLGYAGFHLMTSRPLIQANWTCRGIIALTALASLVFDMAVGLAAGLILELIRSQVAGLRKPIG